MSNLVFGEGERRKGRRELGQEKGQALGGIVSHFLLLRDQSPTREDLKRLKVRNQTLAFLFVIFDFGKLG